MRQIFPVSGPDLEVIPKVIGESPLPASVSQLAALYRDGVDGRPWLRANMIASADGAASLGGRSGGLGGPADRMVFQVLRSIADVILVGAGTARTEKYRPVRESGVWAGLRTGQAPVPPIALVSGSLQLQSCATLFSGSAEDAPTIVITSKTAAAERGVDLPDSARIVTAGDDKVDVSQAVGALADLGYRQILTEGGPSLLGAFVRAGLLDELCLTTSPVLEAGPSGRIVTGADWAAGPAVGAELRLAHVLTDANFLLSRYVRAPG